MEVCHRDWDSQSPAIQRLGQFVRTHAQAWAQGVPDLERFERELHEHMLGIECEYLGDELARYDVTVDEIDVAGVVYRPILTSPETYRSTAGPVTVSRHLYRPTGRGSKSICPLDLRAGIIGGIFTPRAARQAAFVMAHLTSGESQAVLTELGGLSPSRSNLDRLPKTLSPHWEAHRLEWEEALRAQETVPQEAAVLALSVDGVMVPMKGGGRPAKRDQPGKHASGPTGNREVGCGTAVLYDAAGERLQTMRYGRMPEHRKVSLQQQLQAEAASLVALRPDLIRVRLADGAEGNWRLLADIERTLPAPPQASLEIVDFYHACDHLKNGCDAAWGESTAQGKAEFERLKTLLKEADNGADQVIRVLKYQRGRARGRKRDRLDDELTYFRNQRPRMHYAEYLQRGLPIASGVIEATCKTLVTQRMKRSGMAWTARGGQAILTLRSLIQSDRWASAWAMLSADFRQTVVLNPIQGASAIAVISERADTGRAVESLAHDDYSRLPLAA